MCRALLRHQRPPGEASTNGIIRLPSTLGNRLQTWGSGQFGSQQKDVEMKETWYASGPDVCQILDWVFIDTISLNFIYWNYRCYLSPFQRKSSKSKVSRKRARILTSFWNSKMHQNDELNNNLQRYSYFNHRALRWRRILDYPGESKDPRESL